VAGRRGPEAVTGSTPAPTGRRIAGLDDGSHRLIGILDYGLGDHLQAFITAALDRGGSGDEFGNVAGGAVMAGLSWVM